MANFLVENIVKINANELLRGKRTNIAVPPNAEQEFQRLMHQHPQVNHAAGARRKDERSKQQHQGIRNNMILPDVDGPQVSQGSADFSQTMDGKKEYKVQEREANIKQEYQVEDEVDAEFINKFESILAEEAHHHSEKPLRKKSQAEQDKIALQQNSPLVSMEDDRPGLPGAHLHHHPHQYPKHNSGNSQINTAKYANSDGVGLNDFAALKMDDEQSAQSSAEGVEENILFKYLQEKLIESVWVAKGKNAAEVGLVIRLQGGIFEESFFHLNKVGAEYNLSFFIANGELMELIRERKAELNDVLNDRFYDSSFNISFEKIDGAHEHFAQHVDSMGDSGEGQEDENQKEQPENENDIWITE